MEPLEAFEKIEESAHEAELGEIAETLQNQYLLDRLQYIINLSQEMQHQLEDKSNDSKNP